MFEWLKNNVQVINALLNFGMLAVWVIYLQIFIQNFRRERRAKILINLGSGAGLESRCLVSNMSTEAIYIQNIIITLEKPDQTRSAVVTEMSGVEEWDNPSDLRLWTRQGPLESGKVRDMGSLQQMLVHLRAGASADESETARDQVPSGVIEITVVAVYTSEHLSVGARRRFQIEARDDKVLLLPETLETHQIRSRRERRRLETRSAEA